MKKALICLTILVDLPLGRAGAYVDLGRNLSRDSHQARISELSGPYTVHGEPH
jgi:hypothetical protein